MGLCPFPGHREKTPSFSVTESKQIYYCFGCKRSGDIFRFLQEMQGVLFPEAVVLLAQKSGIEIPKTEENKKSQDFQVKKNHLVEVNKKAVDFFSNNLKNLKPQDQRHQYLVKRGINLETIRAFKIGLSNDSWDELTLHLKKHQQNLRGAEELGLLKKKNSGESYYDGFRNRLMFPIFSLAEECLGFGGRTLGDDKAKYLNSPESALFHKGKVLYGLNETAKYIRTEDQIILVEGYMDAIALYQAGIKNVAAILGTAFTSDHARLIKRFTHNVLVLFDGDEAGQAAAERALPILLSEELLPKALVLPDRLDPDDFLKKYGRDHLVDLLKNAHDLFTVVLKLRLFDFAGTNADRVKLMDQMAPILKSIPDQRLLKLYISELSESLGQPVKWIEDAILKSKAVADIPFTKSLAPDVINNKKVIAEKVSTLPKAEVFLLNLALSNRELFVEIRDEKVYEQFLSQEIREIFLKALEASRQRPNEFDKLTALLATEVEPPYLVTRHLDKDWSELVGESPRKLFADCVRKVQEAFLKEQQKKIVAQMKLSGGQERGLQLEQIMNIQKNRRSLFKK